MFCMDPKLENQSTCPEARGGNPEHEPEAKRRKFANFHARFAQVLRSQKYDGSLQKMTQMLLVKFGKTRDHRESVTSVVEKLADRKDMCTPQNNDEKWADMFRDTVFVDVNGGNELDKNLVIEARKTEMEFFRKMAVYRKVPKSEVMRQGGKIISTRWIDTDKGYRGNPNYRSMLVAREIKKDKRQDLFSGHPAARDFKVAGGRLCQRSEASRAFEDSNLRRQQGVLLRARDATPLHQYTR